MKTFPKAKLSLIVSAAVVALLVSACGGGGGSSPAVSIPGGGGNVPVVPAGPVITAATLVTSVPAATYTAGNATLYAQLNDLRTKVGSGLLAQNSLLDTAAAAHLTYLGVNGIAGRHTEDAALASFYAVSPSDRSIKAGYGTGAGEVISSLGNGGREAECLGGWENSVYHMSVLFTGDKDVGIAAGSSTIQFNGSPFTSTSCVVDYGLKLTDNHQSPASNVYVVYPYDGQAGVVAAFNNQAEFPTPVPDLTGVGHPVGIHFEAKVTSVGVFTITATNGNPLSVRILAAPGVTGPGVVSDGNVASGDVFLVPTAALAAKTTYTVVFTGTGNAATTGTNTTVSKTWSFTTA